MPATACLDNSDCVTGAPCASHEHSQPGSMSCCPLRRACTRGRALDGHTCRCTPMRCAAPRALVWRDHGRLQCLDTQCAPCRPGQALHMGTCACVGVPYAAAATWWLSGHGVYEHLLTPSF